MISVLPILHEDELLYSYLSRYAVITGCNTFRGVAESLYVNALNKPNILLLNKLSNDLINKLPVPLESLIERHTMFSWFARFSSYKRRQNAYKYALQMDIRRLDEALPIPNYRANYRKDKVLKYCPCCVNEDRERWGETYFRVSQQIFEQDICPIHKCHLIRTNTSLSGCVTPAFIAAENIIPKESPITYSQSDLECRLSEYIFSIHQAPLNIKSKVEVSEILNECKAMKPFIKREERNMSKFTMAFNEFYSPIGLHRETWQLQKVMTGYCFNGYEIGLVGFFLGLKTDELTGF